MSWADISNDTPYLNSYSLIELLDKVIFLPFENSVEPEKKVLNQALISLLSSRFYVTLAELLLNNK